MPRRGLPLGSGGAAIVPRATVVVELFPDTGRSPLLPLLLLFPAQQQPVTSRAATSAHAAVAMLAGEGREIETRVESLTIDSRYRRFHGEWRPFGTRAARTCSRFET